MNGAGVSLYSEKKKRLNQLSLSPLVKGGRFSPRQMFWRFLRRIFVG